mmetsp:Transcript_12707/g.37237  ORF Transcript_12707/g.37237 Transcript_12707/m.37237 type:complete len:230 (-) Transcript_12707:170-859(-)
MKPWSTRPFFASVSIWSVRLRSWTCIHVPAPSRCCTKSPPDGRSSCSTAGTIAAPWKPNAVTQKPPPPPLTPSPPPLLPRPTLPPTPPFAPPSPVIDIAEPDERPLFQLAIDMADGLSALCGAIATLMSGNILFRRDCERVPRALRKLLRYAAIIFATGFVVGGVLSWIYANEWDSRELVVLACDAVLGWHLMRALVIEAPDLFIVRGVRFGGTRVGFGRRFRGGLGLI